MRRVHEIVIWPSPPPQPPSGTLRAVFGPFNEALRFGIAQAGPVPGPFGKLYIGLNPQERDHLPWVGPALEGVAHADLRADAEAIAQMPEDQARHALAGLAIQALDLFAAQWPWDDESVRTVVRAAGAHAGPYRFVSSRLVARDRASGRTYSTIYEFSGTGTRILAVRREADGTESGTIVVMGSDVQGPDYMFDPATNRTFLHARTAIVRDGMLTYRNRERQPITSVALLAFES